MIRAGVLVVSDRASKGEMEDRSGPAARAALADFARIVESDIVPDDYARIRERLIEWSDGRLDIILTLGGTGLSPRDLTPEATRSVLDRELPGLVFALLAEGLSATPRAALSRAVAGQRGATLIVNLPGSPAAVTQYVRFLRSVLPHAVSMMRGAGHEEPECEGDT